MRLRDEIRGQLKALDLDFIKATATADDRLRQINMLTLQLEGEREKVVESPSGFKFADVPGPRCT